MRIRYLVFLSVLVLHADVALAQRPVRLVLGGGVSMPQGQFGDLASSGWNALAGISISSLMQAWGLRLDAAYSQFGNDLGGGANSTVTSGTLNFTYRLPMTNSPLSPYLIAGAGAYRFGCSGGGVSCASDTRFGWNAGLGTKFTGLHLHGFLEARLHGVNSDAGNVRFVPITLGLLL